jgi:hypothetical protein
MTKTTFSVELNQYQQPCPLRGHRWEARAGYDIIAQLCTKCCFSRREINKIANGLFYSTRGHQEPRRVAKRWYGARRKCELTCVQGSYPVLASQRRPRGGEGCWYSQNSALNVVFLVEKSIKLQTVSFTAHVGTRSRGEWRSGGMVPAASASLPVYKDLNSTASCRPDFEPPRFGKSLCKSRKS